ncbi:MAG: hypothetical protein Q4C10_14065 [Clostridia bacterium]|nr:hypothetical protein [Clostridia bacterium]
MRKNTFPRLIALVLAVLALSTVPALASWNPGGTWALHDGPLAFRTGPGERYAQCCELSRDASAVAIELEQNGRDHWVLCEFQLSGNRVRAYAKFTGIHLDDDIPFASHSRFPRRLVSDAQVFTAPDLHSEVRSELSEGEEVLFLAFEGDYCFIEFADGGQPCRGYVREECFMVDLGEFAEDFPDNDSMTLYVIKESANLYSDPDESSEALFEMPFNASATLWFDSYYEHAPEGWTPLHYGGLFGWGRTRDFSDLRFDSPEQAAELLSLMGEYED